MYLQTLQNFLKLINIFLEFREAIKNSQSFKYFFKYLQTLQYFLKLVNIFLEFLQALQNPKSFRIFSNTLQTFQFFLNLLNIFLEFIKALQNPLSFMILFQAFTNIPVLPEVSKYFSRISISHTKSPKLENIFQ